MPRGRRLCATRNGARLSAYADTRTCRRDKHATLNSNAGVHQIQRMRLLIRGSGRLGDAGFYGKINKMSGDTVLSVLAFGCAGIGGIGVRKRQACLMQLTHLRISLSP